MRNLFTRILAALVMFIIVPLAAQAQEPDQLFRSDDILKVTLTAPFNQISAGRNKSDISSNSSVSYQDGQGTTANIDIGIQVRGNFRLQRKVCSFPPLRLIFKKDSARDTLFEHQKNLKLVTTCRPGSSRYEQYLFNEYLVYRMFNALTPNSFRVRLVEVTYTDSGKDGKSETHYGFFIESIKRVAKRLEHEQVEFPKVSPADHDPHQLDLVSLFQYMVGNTDWSALQGEQGEGCCHNAKLIKDTNGNYLAIPYDFDFSGLVDAQYAFANPKFRLRSVRQRYFRGFCQSDDVVQANLKLFNEQRNAIYALVDAQPGLKNSTKKKDTRYLDEFYRIITDPAKLKRRILDNCRSYSEPD